MLTALSTFASGFTFEDKVLQDKIASCGVWVNMDDDSSLVGLTAGGHQGRGIEVLEDDLGKNSVKRKVFPLFLLN